MRYDQNCIVNYLANYPNALNILRKCRLHCQNILNTLGIYRLEYWMYHYFNIYLKRKEYFLPVNKKLLSVIIVAYNSKHCLDDSLWPFNNCKLNKELEIIIVDNNSKDKYYLKKYETKKNYKVIYNKSNLFFTKAVNQAMKISKGGYVLLLNPDVSWDKKLKADPINKMIGALEENPKNGISGVAQLNKKNKISFFKIGIINGLTNKKTNSKDVFMRDICLAKRKYFYLGDKINCHSKNEKVDCLVGAIMMIKRELINDIGYLPNPNRDTKHWYSDVLYHNIARKNGWNITAVGKSYVYHEFGNSSKEE